MVGIRMYAELETKNSSYGFLYYDHMKTMYMFTMISCVCEFFFLWNRKSFISSPGGPFFCGNQ